MATGIVKWFNNAKGYGFICPNGGTEDVFAHFSVILMDGYKTLKAGQEVEFDIIHGPKGLHAINIRSEGMPPVNPPSTNNTSASFYNTDTSPASAPARARQEVELELVD